MTKQDLEQIRRYMLEKGIKDTELKAANALDGTEIWGAVQEGRSVKISMQDILIFLKPLLEQNDSLFCGFHMSEEDLKGLHPMAKEGSYAWVITFDFPKYPGEVYTFSQMHGWVATGVQASDSTTVDLGDYVQRQEVDEIQGLPEYTSTRSICDGSGNVIEDTYVRRDELIGGSVKGDSLIPDFNTSAFRVTKQNQQIPSILGVTVRAISATGYVRDTQAMFEAYGVTTDYVHTKLGESHTLTGAFNLDADVRQYAYVRVQIYTDLNKSTLIYDKMIPVINDGVDGITPHIGDNGNWFIGNVDTGVVSKGAKGDKGDKGEEGLRGPAGPKGPEGTFDGDPTKIKIDNVSLPTILDRLKTDLTNEVRCWSNATFENPAPTKFHGFIGDIEFEFGMHYWGWTASGMENVPFFMEFGRTALGGAPNYVTITGIRDGRGSNGHNYVDSVTSKGFKGTTDSKSCYYLALKFS